MQVSSTPFGLIKFTSNLSDQLPILFVVALGLQSLIFNHHVRNLLAVSLLVVIQILFKIVFLGIKLGLDDVELALGLIEILTEAVHLLLLGLKFVAMTRLHIFLDFHSHDVCING